MRRDPLRDWLARHGTPLCSCDHCTDWYVRTSGGLNDVSPIEGMLAAAFSLLSTDTTNGWKIHRQWPVLGYLADFAIEIEGVGSLIVVECDGHDFHERTKEQAEHDRKRDRAMAHAGMIVLRFTGREIYRNPFVCAQQVDDIGIGLDVAAAMARDAGGG